MDLKDRILGCMAVEEAVADVYRTFSSIFKEEKDFFEDLMKDELKHSAFFVDGTLFDVFGKEEGQVMPPELPLVKKTLAFAKKMNHQFRTGPVSLEEALRMSLMLEEAMVEIFANEVLAGEGGALQGFTDIIQEEKKHIEKIRDFMAEKGYTPVS